MRAALLATTVLAGAAALPLAAQAADKAGPIHLTVGGYMQAYAGWATQSDGNGPDGVSGTADNSPGANRRNVDFYREGEIYFAGDTTLDNGLQVGVKVDLESEDSTDQIDRAFVWFENPYGRIEYGKNNPAPDVMWYGAPTPADGLGINTPNFLPVNPANTSGVGNLVTTPTTYVGANAASKYETFTYFTPRVFGIQLGASYSPTACQAGNAGTSPCGGSYAGMQVDNLARQYDLYGLAANYTQTFNSVDLAAYGGYYHGSNGLTKGAVGTNTGDVEEWGTGASVGYSGFTLGGGYRHANDPGGITGQTQWDWNVGLTYAVGSWEFGGQYGQSEANLAGRTDDFQGASVGSMYTLGPGIKLSGAVQYFDWDTNSSVAATQSAATNKAWNVMLGTSISF